MVELNDEVLSAYVDGELDAQTRAAVTTIAAGNPAVRRRIEELREADEALRAAFPLEPASDEDIARVRNSAVVAFPKSPVKAKAQWPAFAATAIAAALAGFVVATPMMTTMAARTGADPLAVTGALGAALDSRPSGAVVDGARIVMTLKTADGQVCREFKRDAGAVAQHALACRGASGWTLAALSQTPKAEGYATASGDDAIDATLDRMGAVALEADEEAALLKSGWRR
ncbi:MAG: hypothetical protein KJS97_02985 [Alphaproteobacteria bacterium]|nr:hypothetical protein [Alphaproteobacteria bacterium]